MDSTVEFAVKIKGSSCVENVKNKLINEANISEHNIQSVIDGNEARIVIKSQKPWIEIQEIIENSCGLQSALVGFSDQSAVGIIEKGTGVKGVVRFCSIPNKKGVIIDGVMDGLKGHQNFLSIYEYGDLSDGCNNIGEIYRDSAYGIQSNELGRAVIRKIDDKLSVPELIGRAICVSDGNEKLSCGVISRSAGIFENFKRICVCSGKVLWDERDLQNMVRT